MRFPRLHPDIWYIWYIWQVRFTGKVSNLLEYIGNCWKFSHYMNTDLNRALSLDPWKKKTEIWICQKLSENVKNCKEMVKNDLYSLHLIRALIKYILLYLCNDIYLCHPPFSKYLKKILIYSLICENGSVFKLQVVLEAENKWKLIVAEL